VVKAPSLRNPTTFDLPSREARPTVTRTNSLIPAFPIDAFPEGNRRAINILGLLWKGASSINDRLGAMRELLETWDLLRGSEGGNEQAGDDGRE
jgi:hypothetical protein